MLNTNTKIHFIGIGGIGMSSLAQLLLESGYIVSGSDESPNHLTRKIESRGGKVFASHRASNLGDAQVVVYSTAINKNNPEMAAALKRNIPTLHRAELLSQIMQEKDSVAVTGTHGKTTTASLISSILVESGLDPTLILGGELNLIGGNTHAGKGNIIVAEADESDGSFLFMSPRYSVITNIDADHLDHHKDLEGLIKANLDFAKKTKPNGELFCLFDDLNVRRILLNYSGRFTTFGMYKEADLSCRNVKINGFSSEFDCIYKNANLGRIKLNLPGTYNILNSLAAILVSLHLGVDFDCIKKALFAYSGVKRRFEVKSDTDGVTIVEDYAHHPTEISRVLEAARASGKRRVVVVFQPHRYSRTKDLLDDFGKCFSSADELILTNIYSAWENPIKGLSVTDIYKKVLSSGNRNVRIIPKDNIAGYLYNTAREGDLILILGAGDVGEVAGSLKDLFDREKNEQTINR